MDTHAVTPSAGDLRAGFDAFIEASRRLEASYAELRARAAAVDEQLQATNARLQQALAERDAIFAALPLGVVSRRHDGQVVFQNGEAARLCALAEREGVDLATVATGEHEFGDGGARVQKTMLPDGELLLLEDRSRIRELEREVHRLDRLAGLSELALGVAHEIKNPLNGAMGFCELLLRCADSDAARRHAARIRQGLRQVDEIVRSLLAFARPDGGDGNGVRAAAPASVGSAVAAAAAAAGVAGGRIASHGDLGALVESAPLVRVLTILFANAVEAGGEDVHLELSIRGAGGRVELVVADDGPGIARDLGDRVFEPFVTTKERGTGLGLPLAARVLSFLGGDLTLVNPGERGARFRIRMPLAMALRPQAAEALA